MKVKTIFNLFLLFFICSICFSCAPGQTIKTQITGNLKSKNKVLIASKKSTFKDDIIYDVQYALEQVDAYVKIIDLLKLTEEKSEDYNAIVILNDYKFLKFNINVRKFLQNTSSSEKEKIILITTSGSSTPPKIEGVDAIASASNVSDTGHISEIIIEKVYAILDISI